MYERHGMRHTPIYKTWLGIKDRCFNPNNKSFKHYGGRGIVVCDRWRNSFVAFFEDMGENPPGMSIDRIDNDGDYTPENCRWASKITQANNTRANHNLAFDGRTMTLKEWERETGIHYYTIFDRIKRGWSIANALDTPSREVKSRMITFRGETMPLHAWAKKIGISNGLLYRRIVESGWSIEKALTTPAGAGFHLLTFAGRTMTISQWSRETGVMRSTIRRRLKRGLPVEDVLSPKRCFR